MEWLTRAAIRGLNLTGLRNVQVRGAVAPGGWVWAANHHSWWDGFAAASVLWSSGRKGSLLMDAANLQRFSFLRRIGVVGTDELQAAAASVRAGEPLVIFPEGELRAPGAVDGLRPGAAVVAHRAGADLVPVATRAALRAHAAPEYVVDIGPAIAVDDVGVATEELRTALNAQLRALDQLLATADPAQPLPGFRVVHTGRRDWDERFGGRGLR